MKVLISNLNPAFRDKCLTGLTERESEPPL